MTRYRECKRCVMDTSDPQIIWDDNAHCNHCVTAYEEMPDVMREGEAGRLCMKEMIAAIRKRNRHREYDAVIGLSGGGPLFLLGRPLAWELRPVHECVNRA